MKRRNKQLSPTAYRQVIAMEEGIKKVDEMHSEIKKEQPPKQPLTLLNLLQTLIICTTLVLIVWIVWG